MKSFEQALLRPLYASAVALRRVFWSLRRPVTVGVRAFVVRDGAVLLVRHRAGPKPWGLPGGGVARYERLVEAARRETQEETGAIVRIERLLGIYDSFHDGVSNYIAVFVCIPLSDPKLPRSLEIAEARFFPMDAPPDDMDPGSRRRIADYLAGARGQAQRW